MSVVLAQFTTPFQIKDQTLNAYRPLLYFKMPKDRAYTPPHPDRAKRGWLVMRAAGGHEIFRADVDLAMDGGIGITIEDTAALSDMIVHAGSAAMRDPDAAAKVIDAVLRRIENADSPWAAVHVGHTAHGLDVFHESVRGVRTDERYVVDLRLERLT